MVPAPRPSRRSGADGRPLVILGAGLSGLSLAVALLDGGFSGPLVLIDRRRHWGRDRTWCTWQTDLLRFSELATHRWSGWRTVSHGRETVSRSSQHPYIHLDSERVYTAALERVAHAPTAELRDAEAVLDVDTSGRWPIVRTTRESLEADSVIDATGARGPLLRGRPAGHIELSQRFLGWEVEVDAPRFDPTVATLMDFRAPYAGGVCFMYVLPFSPTRALLEHTSIGVGGPAIADRRLALAGELSDRWRVGDWQIVREERGVIPMTTFAFPAHRGAHVHAVGAAAGAVRASSGYAFSRIQHQVTRVASALMAGTSLPASVAPARFRRLDRVFLTELTGERDAEELFWRLARDVPADSFARFMTDTSSRTDEARVLAALPTVRMGRAAVRTLLPW